MDRAPVKADGEMCQCGRGRRVTVDGRKEWMSSVSQQQLVVRSCERRRYGLLTVIFVVS